VTVRALVPLLAAAVLAGPAAVCAAAATREAPPPPGVQRLKFRYPIDLRPGTNLIRINSGAPKPTVPGYVVRIKPDLTRLDGSVPPTDKIHLHHAVWLSTRAPSTNPYAGTFGLEIFFATGEEKTIVTIPRPYGYPVKPSDDWILNDMIHDLTNRGARLYIVYTVDFVPADSTLGRRMKPVAPVWMNVENSAYPVFDVTRNSGRQGRFTYPDMQPRAYANRGRLNELTLPRSGTLVGFGGHVHPGGLWTDLFLGRDGAGKRIFRSEAKYFGNRPPVSWDLGMTVTPRDWRVRVRRGDVLRVNATYDTRHASWYESMGIMFGWLADDATGKNPFTQKVATRGRPSHGHLPENDNFGGRNTGIPNPTRLPSGTMPDGGVVPISNYRYRFGDLLGAGAQRNPPTVPAGSSLEFVNKDAGGNVFHTVTGCKAPCNRTTGIGYPLANGRIFDSGNLGFGPEGFTAASGRDSWKTPANLQPGTYAYLCRVHPFMRGAFRVVPVG
jgi:plastocyanin